MSILAELPIRPWRSLVAYVVLVPLYWLIPFVAASGHCLICQNGMLYLPVAVLTVVCFQPLISGDRK